MPEMDDLEATREICKLDHPEAATIPVIAMTANAYNEDVEAMRNAGMNAHLSKTINLQQLFEEVAHWAAERQ